LETKICLCCGNPKILDDFSNSKRRKDGKNPYCKGCIKEYYDSNKSAINSRAFERKSQDPRKSLVVSARQRAKEKGIPFDLTSEDFVVPDRCPVLGIPIFVGKGGYGPNSPTLDRLIPELGYIKGNVTVISFRANLIKSDATLEEVLAVYTWMKSMSETMQELLTPVVLVESPDTNLVEVEEAVDRFSKDQAKRYESRSKGLTDENRNRLANWSKEHMTGRPLSESHKKTLSEMRTEHFRSNPEARVKVSSWRKGQKHTEESKLKMAKSRVKLSAEQVARCRDLKGKISISKIAEYLGVSSKSVFNAIHRVGYYSLM